MAKDKPGKPEKLEKLEALSRSTAGSWRTRDGRFRIEGEGTGSWYLVDTGRRDQLGLELTTGPFPTLTAAKEALAEARAAPADAATPAAPPIPKGAKPEGEPGKGKVETPPPPKPAPETWFDRLEPAERRAVRKTIAGLEAEGVADAEAVVRKDRDADVPEVARARLLARLTALSEGATDDALDLVAKAAELLAAEPADARAGLPGWRLVEVDRGGGSRAVQLDARVVRRRLRG
jgi:hypothetical protein